MSWVVSLAGCGGTSVSQCGHETRRHRVRGPFPMGACLLLAGTLALAGCGSSSNSTVTINPRQPDPQQSEPEPELQTGGGSGEGEGAGGQGAGGGTPPPTGTTTTEDGDGDTDSGDTTSTGDGDGDGQDGGSPGGGQGVSGGQTVTQQPQQPPQQPSNQQSPQTGGGQGGGGNPPDNPPPNNPSVVSSPSRSGGIPEPKAIENCGNPVQGTTVGCAPSMVRARTGSNSELGIDYTISNRWNPDYVSLKGKDRELVANITTYDSSDNEFNTSHASYNFAYKNIDPLKYVEVTYEKEDGFIGLYSYKGSSGEITEDVTLKATFNNPSIKALLIEGHIGDSGGIVMNGTNFGQIRFSATKADNGQFLDKQVRFSDPVIRAEIGFGELKGSFKNDGSSSKFPSQVVGELKMKRFFDTSPIRNNKVLEYNENLYSRGDNALAGVFVVDKFSEITQKFVPIKKHVQGTIDMLSYGIWASENSIDNRIVFLEQTTKFNPKRTASDYTSHTTANNTVFYRREDGFKGVYIYEGETGELTGDVDLVVDFRNNEMLVDGNISTDLEIEGNDLLGISMQTGTINLNTGVGDIDIDADGFDDRRTATRLSFGITDIDNDIRTKPTVSHQGLARKLRMVFSPDGVQAQGSTPESYPSQIAGELEINQFKIKASDGDNNTILGVFVADKQE